MGLKPPHKTPAGPAKAQGVVRRAWVNLLEWIAKGQRQSPVCKGSALSAKGTGPVARKKQT